MEWTDIGIVLGARRHGETSAVVELMTRERGRHLGLVRGGAGPRLKPVLQPGNLVSATWRARLDENLGCYLIEALDLRVASYLSVAHALYGLHHLAALCRLLPERDPHQGMFDHLEQAIVQLVEPLPAASAMVFFELRLLAELGFGLDLQSCAATGVTSDLIYVSPRSGQAVSREAGAPWRHKLLALPSFLRDDDEEVVPSLADLRDGLVLTGFFLSRHLSHHVRGSSEPLLVARDQFIQAALGTPSRSPSE